MKKNTLISAASILSLAIAASQHTQADTILLEPEDMEKCLGVAKAGENDCGANDHSCGGYAEVDADPNEWIYLPTGTCEKIVGNRGVKE